MPKLIRKFIESLFAPQLAVFETKLELADQTAQFYRNLWEAERSARIAAEGDLIKEIHRNRDHTEAMTALRLADAGLKSLPSRQEPDNPAESEPTDGLTEKEHAKLRQRARDYCVATSAIVTNQEIEDTYQLFLLDPQRWLSN